MKHSPVEAMCLEHIAAQDKPMPVFCINDYTSTLPIKNDLATPPYISPIKITSGTWRTVLNLIQKEGSRTIEHPLRFGTYQATLIPKGASLYVKPETMKQLTLTLINTKELNNEQSQMLENLKFRISATD